MTLDDYMQAGRIAIWRKLPLFDPARSGLDAWAARVSHNAIRDEVRRCDEVGRSIRADGIKGAARSLEHQAGPAIEGARRTLLRDLIAAPRQLDRRASYETLGELLAGLDERQRVVVFLLEVQDLSDAEAGEVLDLPETCVREVHAEAMALLRGQQHSPQGPQSTQRSQRQNKVKITFSSASGQFGPLFGGETN